MPEGRAEGGGYRLAEAKDDEELVYAEAES